MNPYSPPKTDYDRRSVDQIRELQRQVESLIEKVESLETSLQRECESSNSDLNHPITNPYNPPKTRDDRRSNWPAFPFWELVTVAVIGRSAYLFVMVGTGAGAMCLVPAVALAIVAYGRRNSI